MMLLSTAFLAEISLSDYLIFGTVLFGLSVIGILINRKNLITLLMSIELMLLAINTNFIAFSHFAKSATGVQAALSGQIFVFFILTVSAAEIALALAVLIKLFKINNSLTISDIATLKH